jgi:hypothetical protein
MWLETTAIRAFTADGDKSKKNSRLLIILMHTSTQSADYQRPDKNVRR